MENEKIVKASLSGIRRQSTEDKKEIKIGDFIIDNSNPFRNYRQIGSIDIVSDPLDKAALEMTADFKISHKDEKQDIAELNEWATEVNLASHTFAVLRELMEKGTVVVYVPQQSDIKELEILPMEYITLLPKGIQPGASPSHLLKGKVDKICVNENATSKEVKKETLDRKEVILYRYNHVTHFFKDTINRDTFGIYGHSIISKIEWRLQFYFNLLESYRKYVKRYGYGRLFFNSPFLAKLLESESYENFEKIRKDMIKEQEAMQENEDLFGVGMEVQQLYTGTKLDILKLKESLERDIASMLFTSNARIDKTEKARSITDAYRAELNRTRLLYSYRNLVRTQLRQLVRKQAENMGIKNTDKIQIGFSKLDKIQYSSKEVLDMFTGTLITKDEAREVLGFLPAE